MTLDVKNFYLNPQLIRYEYLWLKMSDLPEDIIKHYHLTDNAVADGHVYSEICKEMYGLSQVGLLAHELLDKDILNNMATGKQDLTRIMAA